jgi:hypothetical protein
VGVAVSRSGSTRLDRVGDPTSQRFLHLTRPAQAAVPSPPDVEKLAQTCNWRTASLAASRAPGTSPAASRRSTSRAYSCAYFSEGSFTNGTAPERSSASPRSTASSIRPGLLQRDHRVEPRLFPAKSLVQLPPLLRPRREWPGSSISIAASYRASRTAPTDWPTKLGVART